VTSTAVQPLSKHGVSAQTISWTFHQVDDTGSNRSNYAVTGINDDEHIVGTYKAPPLTKTYTAVTNSYIGTPHGTGTSLSYTFTYDNYPNAVESNISALSPKAGSSASVTAGWLREPGHLDLKAPYPVRGAVDNHGLWTVMHFHPGEDPCEPPHQALELLGINDGETAVGFYTDTKIFCKDQALQVSKGEQFSTITPTGYYSAAASGINNSGAVVGTGSFGQNGPTSAWYLAPPPGGTVETLSGIPGIQSEAEISINNSNVIAGSYTQSSETHGFICFWNLSTNPQCNSYQTVPNPCGGCGGAADHTIVYAINDREDISGSYVGSDGLQHGFVGIAKSGALHRRHRD
jgi:hypothetical protein